MGQSTESPNQKHWREVRERQTARDRKRKQDRKASDARIRQANRWARQCRATTDDNSDHDFSMNG